MALRSHRVFLSIEAILMRGVCNEDQDSKGIAGRD
jgi:hypothetical protein